MVTMRTSQEARRAPLRLYDVTLQHSAGPDRPSGVISVEAVAGGLIQTSVGRPGGWGSPRGKRSGCAAWAALNTRARAATRCSTAPECTS